MNKNKILFIALLGAALASPTAFAQDLAGGFVRADIGKANVKDGGGKDTSYGLRGGYFFTPNIGVELGYANLFNETDKKVPVEGSTTLFGTDSAKFSGMTLGVVGKYNIGGTPHEGFYVGGRAGIMRGKYSDQYTTPAVGTAPAIKQSYSGTSTTPYFGVSAGYDFTQNMGVSLNYDRYQGKAGKSSGDKFNVNNVSLGFEYRF